MSLSVMVRYRKTKGSTYWEYLDCGNTFVRLSEVVVFTDGLETMQGLANFLEVPESRFGDIDPGRYTVKCDACKKILKKGEEREMCTCRFFSPVVLETRNGDMFISFGEDGEEPIIDRIDHARSDANEQFLDQVVEPALKKLKEMLDENLTDIRGSIDNLVEKL